LNLGDYKHHSDFWNSKVNQAAAQLDKEINVNEDLLNAKEDPSRPEHYQTVDQEQEYNGMLLQLDDYKRHTPLWEARVNNAAA